VFQPPGSRPPPLRVATHGKRVASFSLTSTTNKRVLTDAIYSITRLSIDVEKEIAEIFGKITSPIVGNKQLLLYLLIPKQNI